LLTAEVLRVLGACFQTISRATLRRGRLLCLGWRATLRRGRLLCLGWRATLRRNRLLCLGWRTTLRRGRVRVSSDIGRDGARPSTIIWLRPQAASGQCVTPPQACCWTSLHLPDIIQYGLGATVWAAAVGLRIAAGRMFLGGLNAIQSGITP